MVYVLAKLCPWCIGRCRGDEKTRLGTCNDCCGVLGWIIYWLLATPAFLVIYIGWLLFLVITCCCFCDPEKCREDYICDVDGDGCGFCNCGSLSIIKTFYKFALWLRKQCCCCCVHEDEYLSPLPV
jgi:hypothetical protein